MADNHRGAGEFFIRGAVCTDMDTVNAPRKLDLLRAVLRPLIRFCLSNAIASRELIEALKCTFVDVAVEELKKSSSQVNVTRISVMTGLDRRDVTRIHRYEKVASFQQSWTARLMGQWENDKRFTNENGSPRALSYKGKKNEFRRLAASVSQDINSGAMLRELQRIGAVKTEGDFVSLNKLDHDQRSDTPKALNLMLRNVETLSAAVQENITNLDKLKNLNTRTSFDNISRKELPRIRRWFLEQGAQMHKRTRQFLSQFDNDLHPELEGECGRTVVLTTYSWTEGIDDMPQK